MWLTRDGDGSYWVFELKPQWDAYFKHWKRSRKGGHSTLIDDCPGMFQCPELPEGREGITLIEPIIIKVLRNDKRIRKERAL